MKQKNSTNQILGFTLLLIGVTVISYMIKRTDSLSLLSFFAVSFSGYALLINNLEERFYFSSGLTLRIIILFAIPQLSDDYFRFLWDGTINHLGQSPYFSTPKEFIASSNNSFLKELYPNLNSKDYYAVYPPLNQWIFWLASLPQSIFGGVVILKLILLSAEIGTYFFIKKIIQRFRLKSSRILLYWLNPLIIIEIIGNMHFEGIMLCFLLMGLHSYSRLKDNDGSFHFAFSAITKLFSLMLLPLLVLKTGWRRGSKTILITLILITLSFLPYLSGTGITHFFSSIDLYFQKFEFNASVFYIVRWIGFKIKGYDIIQTWGPALAVISLILILITSWVYRFRNRLSLFNGFTLIFTIFLLFSPVVHPWYIITLLGLSIFTDFKFPIVWSGIVVLSYVSYANPEVIENPYLLFIEYGIVISMLFFELKKRFSWNRFISAFKV